jgi:hypothetical protein
MTHETHILHILRIPACPVQTYNQIYCEHNIALLGGQSKQFYFNVEVVFDMLEKQVHLTLPIVFSRICSPQPPQTIYLSRGGHLLSLKHSVTLGAFILVKIGRYYHTEASLRKTLLILSHW